MLPVLVQWHIQDPPDANERARNNEIELLQGNTKSLHKIIR
jgi:endonuclease I